jgi:hypothetical protein
LKLSQSECEKLKQQKDKELENLNNQLKQTSESYGAQNKQLVEKSQTLETQYDESRKSNLELQARITELMQNSGDNSAQLISLNEKIKEKDKYWS